ncbi:unnamed protein product [Rotaria magnacalcarata]|uniref:Uncharacterized protein n=1 Tax=Rotaria magnacalcarata TaxID=392030 RepID=A0A818ZRZ2_9BILA|nr:unnamed protein product [Rotaria magnacalcarata]CAF3771598.1 unnamed protein product [Rotaria magnacalcarata]
MKSAQQSNINEKPNHLNLSISYRFIHLVTHAILLVLHELDQLSNSNLPNRDYIRQHFENDYTLICQLSTNPDQCYIWLYKLINHLVDSNIQQDSSLDHNQKVIEFEKCIEDKLIIPHIGSIINEIREYRLAYNKFFKQDNNELTLQELIDELAVDEEQYPLLSLFHMSNTHIANSIDSFYAKLRVTPNAEKAYPMTMLFLKRSEDYANIRYLHPIITFVNYLSQKFNYRITRKDAEKKMIQEVLFKDSDKTTELKLYNDFIEA